MNRNPRHTALVVTLPVGVPPACPRCGAWLTFIKTCRGYQQENPWRCAA